MSVSGVSTSCEGPVRKLCAAGNVDIYDMWLALEPLLEKEQRLPETGQQDFFLVLEQVTTAILFFAYLRLVEMIDLPAPTDGLQDGIRTYEDAVASCIRVREVLDVYVYPALLRLGDAAEGSVSSRGQQSLSLYWLMRGMLCYNLNALSILLSINTQPHTYEERAPIECMEAAIRQSDAAREFAHFPLAPHWAGALLRDYVEGKKFSWQVGAESTDYVSREWRLHVSVDNGGASDTSFGVLPPHQCVTDVALLPAAVMHLWLFFARTLFRSAPADLVRTCGGGAEPNLSHPPVGVASVGVGAPSPPARENKNETKRRAPLNQRKRTTDKLKAFRLEETRQRAVESEIGFWFRWREALATHCLLGLMVNRPSLLDRYYRLLLPHATNAGCPNCTTTPFMRALEELYPVAADHYGPQWRAQQLVALHQQGAQQQGGRSVARLLQNEELSLTGIDHRLRRSVEYYEPHCVH
ncbi:unnamed protein product [Trypanosoma congolense IL3000]|uniref:WGS project CAEQ00000000 data, annotated contig 1401 n=1 Tax=Trypanosoma congolense (strain IL3000) TaxID=1068625 RepID=F9W5Y3_TRYCI|nr:unnamed protein product [Trypanosoma congolense IL3000]